MSKFRIVGITIGVVIFAQWVPLGNTYYLTYPIELGLEIGDSAFTTSIVRRITHDFLQSGNERTITVARSASNIPLAALHAIVDSGDRYRRRRYLRRTDASRSWRWPIYINR